MEWLINLIFSNLWIIILIYVLVRGLLRSNLLQQRRMQIPSARPRYTMEAQMSEYTGSLEENKTELINENKGEIKEKKRNQASIQPKINQSLTDLSDTSDTLSTPAQGMIWSEIFGPPVSKRSGR